MQYYQALISAEQTPQANRILDALMAKQLVLGGPVIGGPAKFLWDFSDSAVPANLREPGLRVVEQDYTFILTYTREDLKDELVIVAEEASLEEVCMISLAPIEVNASLRTLIDHSFAGRDSANAPSPAAATVASTFVAESDISPRTKRSPAQLSTQELVDRYFSLVTALDPEPYFAQFSVDAVVEDEGEQHAGIDAIRAWRSSVPPVTYQRSQSAFDGRSAAAAAEITGDFPQSPVTLTFSFTFTGAGEIQTLTIR